MSIDDMVEGIEPMSIPMSIPVNRNLLADHDQMSCMESPPQYNNVGNANEPPESQNFSRNIIEDAQSLRRDYTLMEGRAQSSNVEHSNHREQQPTHPHPHPPTNNGDVHYHYHYHYCCGHGNSSAERNGNWGRPPDGGWHFEPGAEQHETEHGKSHRPGRSDQNNLRPTVIRWRGA